MIQQHSVQRYTTRVHGTAVYRLHLAIACILIAGPTSVFASDSLERSASWNQPELKEKTDIIRKGLQEIGTAEPQVQQSIERILTCIEEQQNDGIDAIMLEFASHSKLVDGMLNGLRASTFNGEPKRIQAALQLLKSDDWQTLPEIIRSTSAVWAGRRLTQGRYFDEALNAFATVDPKSTIDPAATLFYRGACNHALMNKDAAMKDLQQLLENEAACPIRYSRTAKMMLADLKPLKEDSLDEISRIMGDVTRRLDLGRAGKEVKNQEQKIIDKLDKLIEELEEQQQQQQQQQQQASSGQGGNSQGGQSTPMSDSQIAGGNGNGDVDRKKIQQKDGWGNLPPAERQDAIQQISRDLPTHYREAIEAYFRKLATDRD